ncbi:MAG: LacI family DNA-binding transcriptional regulator [Acetobacteraceae bacterium]|nr:LacI family DNA-binding transcriptional regulator [Acetobacteraceae bacterium]
MPRRNASTSPIAAVAARAGVSIATVSRVINGVPNKATADTIRRVQEAVAALSYRPISAGRALRERRSRLVAVLAPNLANPAMAAIAASIEGALRGAGLVMVVCDTHDDPAIQDEYLAEMRAQRARAAVLLGAVASPGLDAMPQDLPLLFVGRRRPGRLGPYIGIDNRLAGTDAANFFLERGLRVLGVLHGAMTSSATAERVTAFCDRLAQSGHRLPRSRVRTRSDAHHAEIGLLEAPELLRGACASAGIFCSSDLIAYGAHRALEARRARVTILGFDDNPLNDWLAPWLSSIQVPFPAFGPAVATALANFEHGETVADVILPHRLIARRQCPDEHNGH